MPIPEGDSRLRLKTTAHVIYYHKDLTQARKFLLDFGLSIARETPGKEIFFAGYGGEPFVYIARQPCLACTGEATDPSCCTIFWSASGLFLRAAPGYPPYRSVAQDAPLLWNQSPEAALAAEKDERGCS